MLGGRKFLSPLSKSFLSKPSNLHWFSSSVEASKSSSWGRKAVKVALISLTGGFALSALDDLAIYNGCSSKAIEKASLNQKIIEALGEPIIRGPWYNATLAVAHRRHSVSCTFPVSGPQGNGIFQLKAVRQDNSWFSFLRAQDWEILIMEALLHIPGNEEKNRTYRISLSEVPLPASSSECKDCISQELPAPSQESGVAEKR